MRIEGSTDWYGVVRISTEKAGVVNRESKITFCLFLYYGVLWQKRQESRLFFS